MNRLTAPPTPRPTNMLTGVLPAKGPLGAPPPGLSQPNPPPQQQTPPTRDQIEEAIDKAHRLNDGLRLLLNKPGGVTRGDVIDEAGALISEGVLSSQQAAQELQSLPDDQAQIQDWLRNHIQNSTITRGRLCEMLVNHGAQQRAAQAQPPMQPQPQPQMQNALTAGLPQNG